ncbi:hypothetical protein [Porphyrobacter sp. AAP82]|uniref:hypothetical protein n=1 Tax=Porphyrobacter sp. AAP82 TaxID=1248917 RepID=UPI0002EE8109|nr:hypothetical protein [Porphyrobacter sp. AAP82]
MSAYDWNAGASLRERDDSGSELQYNFALLAEGTLREMVARVLAMDTAQRARVLIEVEGGKSLNLGEILELSAKEGLA